MFAREKGSRGRGRRGSVWRNGGKSRWSRFSSFNVHFDAKGGIRNSKKVATHQLLVEDKNTDVLRR